MPAKKNKESFKGEIRVASRVIDYLSSGLYPSPAACLKELVNNGFDADASKVNVFVKPDADSIIIEDNGQGMTKTEFVTHFERISESHKRDHNQFTNNKRPKIGKIGIGFIAANEICEVMELFSTVKGSDELLHITINFDEMRKPIEERRRGDNNDEFVKADYFGEILETANKESYTRLFLHKVRGEAREILVGASTQTVGKESQSLYGLSAASVADKLRSPTLRSWKEFDAYSETMLQIALNVPVAYAPEWVPKKLASSVRDFEKTVTDLEFQVFYDGTELRKPTVFNPTNDAYFIDRFNFRGKHVAAKGYFYAQHGGVKPIDLHGLLVRIRNSAVGEYDQTFWGFSPSEFSLIQRWVSVEIWADDQLEEAMNIDRRTLRVAHPAFVELRDAIHSALRKVLAKARLEIYEAGNAERKTEKARETARDVGELLKSSPKRVSATLVKDISRIWEKSKDDNKVQKALLRKFSVLEFYSIIIEVAKDIMTPSQLAKFLKALTDRLSK